MATIVRKFLAGLSACGIAASIIAYIKSMSGIASDDMSRWEIGLGAGAIALYLPMVIVEPALLNGWSFKERFTRGMPRWAVICLQLVTGIAIAHFVWLSIQDGRGVALIEDGQYVLKNHGRLLRVLTQEEYLRFGARGLREFAGLMVATYLMPTMYWWFPRRQQRSG